LGKSKLFISDEISGQVYKKIENFLQENLKRFDYLIVDATFYKRKWQEMAQKISGKDNLVILDINCPLKVCLERNKKRKKPLAEKVLHIIYHQIERPKAPDLIINTKKIDPKDAIQLILFKIIQKQCLTKRGLLLFLKKFGTLYSQELGINLDSRNPLNYLNGFWPLYFSEPGFQKMLLKILIRPWKNIIFNSRKNNQNWLGFFS
jgi:predicted kinase